MSQVDVNVDENPLVEGHITHDSGAGTEAPASVRALHSDIRAYQVSRSGRQTGCRYLPSCSDYALEAIDRHGPTRGTWMAVRRISRCGPWGGHGIDPVPERSTP